MLARKRRGQDWPMCRCAVVRLPRLSMPTSCELHRWSSFVDPVAHLHRHLEVTDLSVVDVATHLDDLEPIESVHGLGC